jgi:hypothetical protein
VSSLRFAAAPAMIGLAEGIGGTYRADWAAPSG